MKKVFTLFILLGAVVALPLYSQSTLTQHIDYSEIYDFMDELANDGYIDINSAIKPYSQEFIAKKLEEALAFEEKMSRRQRKDLNFHLNNFNPSLGKPQKSRWTVLEKQGWGISFWNPRVTYADSVGKEKVSVRMSIAPIIGGELYWNKSEGTIYRTRVGFDFSLEVWKGFSIYANYRDVGQNRLLFNNPESYKKMRSPFTGVDTTIYQPGYLTNAYGGAYKRYNGTSYGGDYSEMRGGVYYTWKWGRVGLVNDQVRWGDSYFCSNILSGRTPSFPMITLTLKPLKWVELNYIHGWLVSNQIDSTNYYVENTGDKKYRYRNKYIAANMVTFTPIKHLNLSVGNSIVYSETNVQPAYLIPLMYYKPLDHALSMGVENQNSQIFFNLSTRNLKHTHFYASLYIDEFSISRWKTENKERNPVSYKVGARVTNFPLKNLSAIVEYTLNDILVYKHSIQSTNYTSKGYIMGHYLADNSQEIYAAIQYKPIRGLNVKLSYVNALKGNEYDYYRKNVREIISQPLMKDIVWRNNTLGLNIVYEMFKNCYATLNCQYSDIRTYDVTSEQIKGEYRTTAEGFMNLYTPAYYRNKTLTISAGFSVGL